MFKIKYILSLLIEGILSSVCYVFQDYILEYCHWYSLFRIWYLFLRPKIFIDQKALDTLAYLCDGDARVGLNSLQLAVQAQVNLARTACSGQDDSQDILIKEEHVKEGLQRSHILYDKAGKSQCTYVVAHYVSTHKILWFLPFPLIFPFACRYTQC